MKILNITVIIRKKLISNKRIMKYRSILMKFHLFVTYIDNNSFINVIFNKNIVINIVLNCCNNLLHKRYCICDQIIDNILYHIISH